jgi:hypothetical protein
VRILGGIYGLVALGRYFGFVDIRSQKLLRI